MKTNQVEIWPTDEVQTMPAISLWQPWASLVACNAKPDETRSWPAPNSIVGERVAIHASKTRQGMFIAARDKELWRKCIELLDWDGEGNLPFGAVLAIVTVQRSVPTEIARENIFGDYSPGRFAWPLREVIKLPHPIPARGAQGIFRIPVIAT